MPVAGNFPDVSFPDLIQFYCLSKRTVAIRVTCPDLPERNGEFYVADGELLDATLGDQVGVEAFFRALGIRRGTFEVEVDAHPPVRRIHVPLNEVLLQGMQRMDEAGRTLEPLVPTSAGHAEPALCRDCGTWHPENELCPEPPAQADRSVTTSPASVPGVPTFTPLTPEGTRRRLLGLGLLGGALLGCLLAVVVLHGRRPRASRATAPATSVAASRSASPEPTAAVPHAAPAAGSVQGVTADSILFGIVAPFSGPAKELGRQTRVGIELAFAQANQAGGVHGRMLRLAPADDGFEPQRVGPAMISLWEQARVFAFVGNVGTANVAVAAPFALEHRAILFGSFSGASLIRRDPPDRYVFNFRASDTEETAAAVKYLLRVRGVRPSEVAVFAEDDAFGEAGFQGVVKVLRKVGRNPAAILRVAYPRNRLEVNEAAARIRANLTPIKAVVMVATYRPAARFIARMRELSPAMHFTNVSSVGSSALAEELMELSPGLSDGVLVTQVVPPPDSNSTPVTEYASLLARTFPDEKPDFVSLEGYLAARVLVEGLRRAGRDLDTEKLADTLESLKDLDLGLGTGLSFGPGEHQASHRVWGTVLDARGRFQMVDLE